MVVHIYLCNQRSVTALSLKSVCAVGETLWSREYERERENARARERRDAHTNCTGARVDDGEANISAGNFLVALQVSCDFIFLSKIEFLYQGFRSPDLRELSRKPEDSSVFVACISVVRFCCC